MKRGHLITAMMLVGAVSPAVAHASAPNDNADCVSAYSVHFAQLGIRSDIAQTLAENSHPAGLNDYSQVAQYHGSFAECSA